MDDDSTRCSRTDLASTQRQKYLNAEIQHFNARVFGKTWIFRSLSGRSTVRDRELAHCDGDIYFGEDPVLPPTESRLFINPKHANNKLCILFDVKSNGKGASMQRS